MNFALNLPTTTTLIKLHKRETVCRSIFYQNDLLYDIQVYSAGGYPYQVVSRQSY